MSLIGVLCLAFAGGTAAGTARPVVHAGQLVRISVSGLDPDQALSVDLVPLEHRGGSCCGLEVSRGKHWYTDANGGATVSFRWPDSYLFCNGQTNCSRVRWRRGGGADVFFNTNARTANLVFVVI